jgi:hypothetical protein
MGLGSSPVFESDESLAIQRQIGSKGDGHGQLSSINGIAVCGEGTKQLLAVADGALGRVLLFNVVTSISS